MKDEYYTDADEDYVDAFFTFPKEKQDSGSHLEYTDEELELPF